MRRGTRRWKRNDRALFFSLIPTPPPVVYLIRHWDVRCFMCYVCVFNKARNTNTVPTAREGILTVDRGMASTATK